MRNRYFFIIVNLMMITLLFGQEQNAGGYFLLASRNYYVGSDPLQVIPAAGAGGSLYCYVPFSEALSSYFEGSVLGEYDFVTNEAGFLFGASGDIGYRADELVLRAEVFTQGDFSLAETSPYLEIQPSFHVVYGDVNYSLRMRHLFFTRYEEDFLFGYRGALGFALSLWDSVIFEGEGEGGVTTEAYTISPLLKFTWYSATSVMIKSSIGGKRSIAAFSGSITDDEFWELDYAGEIVFLFLDRSSIVAGLKGQSQWYEVPQSDVPALTLLDPWITVKLELSDTVMLDIDITSRIPLPLTQDEPAISGGVHASLEFSF